MRTPLALWQQQMLDKRFPYNRAARRERSHSTIMRIAMRLSQAGHTNVRRKDE